MQFRYDVLGAPHLSVLPLRASLYTDRIEPVSKRVPLFSQKQISGRLAHSGLLPYRLHHTVQLAFSGRSLRIRGCFYPLLCSRVFVLVHVW